MGQIDFVTKVASVIGSDEVFNVVAPYATVAVLWLWIWAIIAYPLAHAYPCFSKRLDKIGIAFLISIIVAALLLLVAIIVDLRSGIKFVPLIISLALFYFNSWMKKRLREGKIKLQASE
jgi:hypothetical protein